MTTQELTEKVFEIFEKAVDSPKKYLRLGITQTKRVISLNGKAHPIDKCTLFYRDDDNQPVQYTVDAAFIEENKFSLMLALRPHKHLAVATVHREQQMTKFFRLDQEPDSNDDYFICMLESNRETFLLAYLHGTYFLRTFDADFPITLYDLVHFLTTQSKNEPAKEENDHGKEA